MHSEQDYVLCRVLPDLVLELGLGLDLARYSVLLSQGSIIKGLYIVSMLVVGLSSRGSFIVRSLVSSLYQ